MIDKNNLKQLVEIMGFQPSSDACSRYEKYYQQFGCSIEVDFEKEKIIYPEDKGFKVNDTTTCNFEHPENFVVFECVNRLLEKGYRPEHLELEKRWNLGHEAKGGKADICVYDKNGTDILCIIECKTDDNEYSKELANMKNDGGQLFSYWQQEKSTKWLALYASTLTDKVISYKTESVDCSDDANILELAKKDTSIKVYKDAHSVAELYSAWDETYEKRICGDVIFRDDTQSYNIGVTPLRKKNLVDFSENDKIVNKFEEILRHNNVSDKENAFNKLIVLFICKLVDEIQKVDHDITEFQYKIGTDTYESLQDRLQKLYQKGMEHFMKEKIFYVSDDYAENLVQQYTGQKRQKMIDDLKQTLRILKFYTNNDFAFKDVHNEELFYQNGKILVEVVNLFQKYRIIGSQNLQLLGDLFEQLLNKGFKQNEGQFFTPIPIARFIWNSLPVEDIVKTGDKFTFPRIIDYACGAGHFLTEGFEAVNDCVKKIAPELLKDNFWVKYGIYGIEKDYRLARVSKISLFMHGAGDGNIVFGDGLDNYPDKSLENNSFDILVANPPYSVSAFKPHLKLKNNTFELLDKISNDGSEIEALFVERIAQLVKPGGVAAIILPASILLNETLSSYIGAREKLIQNFEIKAIVRLASKTFGETQTSTIILFLKKYSEPPKKYEIVQDSISAIFSMQDLTDWEDSEIIVSYLEKIKVSDEQYKNFLEEKVNWNEWRKDEYFGMYTKEFAKLPQVKNKEKQKTFKKLDEATKEKWRNRFFYNYVKNIEKEKLYYFTLIYKQITLIVTAPKDKKKQVKFLGYDWSKRKGQEGIKPLKKGGSLYSDSDRDAKEKLAYVVRAMFKDEMLNVKPLESYYNYVNLTDMFDFDKVVFNKVINTNVNREIKINSKYGIKKLGECCEKPMYGASVSAIEGNPETDYRYIRITDITEDGFLNNNWMTAEKVEMQYELQKGDFLFARTGATAGKTFLYTEEYGKAIFAGYLIRFRTKEELQPGYLDIYTRTKYYLEWVENYKKVNERPSLNAQIFSDILIPIPPTEVQNQIIKECSRYNEDYLNNHNIIENQKREIKEIFVRSYNEAERVYKLSSEEFKVTIGKRVLESELSENGKLKVFSANVIESIGNIDKEDILTDYNIPSVLWGIDGDWMVRYLEADTPFYPTDHCGVIRTESTEIVPQYLAMALEYEGEQVGFDRTNRASTERISSLKIKIPEKHIQESVVEQCTKCIQIIDNSKKQMELVIEEKQKIFDRYVI